MSFFGSRIRKLKHFFVPSRHNAYRPHLLRRQALVALLLVVLVAEAALVANLLVRQSGVAFLAAVVQSEIISLTNTERVANHVGQLTENAQLDAAAQAKAADMAAKGYFAHVSPEGKVPWAWVEESGYDYQYAGENLAVRFVDSKDVVEAWMASPSHRANVVKGVYTEIGVATAEGMYKGQPATFVVQYFGKPAAVGTPSPVVAASPPVATVAATTAVQVLGAAITVAPPPSFSDSLGRQLIKMLAEPRATTGLVLGGVAILLMMGLAFAFFNHIQLQAADLLVPGVLVVGVALILIGINRHALPSALPDEQAASVVYSLP